MTITYGVLVKDGLYLLWARDGSGESWGGQSYVKLTEAEKDGAVQAAKDANAPYEVFQSIDEGKLTRIDGTAHLR